jgi:hypothetical protein
MDLFSTTTLNRVIEEIPLTGAYFLNAFFPEVETSEQETVSFDTVRGRRTISPFVSPIVAGKVVRELGFKTQSLKPAYIKDKRVFNPNSSFKRRAGEKIGGSLTPEQRLAASVNFALTEQLEMWLRRLEAMAVEALRTGKLVIEGDEYPRVDIDFGRDPALDVTLTGGDLWSASTATPADDVEVWGQLVHDKSFGLIAKDVYMAVDVWHALRARILDPNSGLKKLFDLTAAGLQQARAEYGPILVQPGAPRLVAVMGDYRFFVVSIQYEDVDGTTKELLPSGEILMPSHGVQGVRHFGAIQDLKAGIQPRAFFVKSWEDEDPSVRYILGQSAPLTVPYRPNGTLRAKVL